jgi:hypothetical protein
VKPRRSETKLNEALGLKSKWDDIRREITNVNAVQAITVVRTAFARTCEVPKDSEATSI